MGVPLGQEWPLLPRMRAYLFPYKPRQLCSAHPHYLLHHLPQHHPLPCFLTRPVDRHAAASPPSLPCDPAVGTWNKICKFAKWGNDKANELLGVGVEPDPRVETKRAFLEARSEICDWKRDVKHRLRAGLEPNAPPASYPNQFMVLEAQMKALRL